MGEQGEVDKRGLMALKNGGKYIIPESDYGKAEIWYINGDYFIFSIPIGGGCPRFEEAVGTYHTKERQVSKVLQIIDTWT